MKLAIIGSRTATDYYLLLRVMEQYFPSRMTKEGPESPITEIISGGAKGADSLAARFAKENAHHRIKLTEFLPDWNKHGKRAGFVRNEDIIKNADRVLALWDGVSKGTANSLSIAKRLKKDTLIIYF